MDVILNKIFRIGTLAFCLSSSLTLADTTAEMDRANKLYEEMHMMDAAVLFKKLALENHLPAQARLGELLDYTEDHVEAVGWYITAAFQGNAKGAYSLGQSYFSGLGINKDPAQALYWFKFAADKDNLNAVKALENGYRRGPVSGLPVNVDIKQAEFWKSKKILLEAQAKKEFEEQLAAAKKAVEEKREATRKADEEAAKNKAKGNSK